jgi:hypothetical protein
LLWVKSRPSLCNEAVIGPGDAKLARLAHPQMEKHEQWRAVSGKKPREGSSMLDFRRSALIAIAQVSQ